MQGKAVVIIGCALLLSGCFDDVEQEGPPPVVTPTPTPSPSSVSGTIGTSGGSLSLENQITLTVPPGTFDQATNVTIERSQVDITGDSPAAIAASQFSIDRVGASYTVTLGTQQPLLPIMISAQLPVDFGSALPSGKGPLILAESENESDLEEAAPTWDTISGIVNVARTSMSFEADPVFFVARNNQGRRVGTFGIAAVAD